MTDGPIPLAELTAEALDADPDAPVDPDAVPFGVAGDPDLLPAWYAPGGILPPSRRPVRRRLVVAVILALVVVNGAGLCVTSGLPEIAW